MSTSATSAYGGELRLISQVLTLGSKLGDPEQLLKLLAGNQELLAYVQDYAAFHFGQRQQVMDSSGVYVNMRFVCFSETHIISNDEANVRVQRLGRYATVDELQQFVDGHSIFGSLLGFRYPIVVHSMPTGYRGDEFKYTSADLRGSNGRLEISSGTWGGLNIQRFGMRWSPATMFAVVANDNPKHDVLSWRRELKKRLSSLDAE